MVFQQRTANIQAPVDAVWARLVAVAAWPDWYGACTAMWAPARVAVGSQFRFRNGGTPIRAEVTELAPMASFGFTGRAWGVTARNRWQLTPLSPDATAVTVEESMAGLLPVLLRRTFDRRLGEGLDAWLAALGRSLTAEGMEPAVPAPRLRVVSGVAT